MATESKSRVLAAIIQSACQTEIVHLANLTRAEQDYLVAICQGFAEGAGIDGDQCEYWGVTEDGDEWRVHGTL